MIEKRTMNKGHFRHVVVASLLAAMLAACGGGGADTPTAAAGDTPVPLPSGGGGSGPGVGVAAPVPFVAGASPRFMLFEMFSQIFGGMSSFTQREDGAMVALGGNTLTGAALVNDIAGDASRAVGRWSRGTATTTVKTQTLLGGNDAYHYQVFNLLERLPTTGNVVCGEGLFSTPTYVGGGGENAARTATVNASATFTPGPNGVAVSLTINLAAGGGRGTAVFNGTIEQPLSTVIDGGIGGMAQGSALGVGDGGNGSFLVVSAYRAALTSGALYQGMASLRCK